MATNAPSSSKALVSIDVLDDLLHTVGDSVSQQYRSEIVASLASMGIQVNKDALDTYKTSSSPTRARQQIGSALPGGGSDASPRSTNSPRASPRLHHLPLTAKIGSRQTPDSSSANGDPATPRGAAGHQYNASLDLPALHDPAEHALHGHGKFRGYAQPSTSVFYEIYTTSTSVGGDKMKYRIPKKPLAQIYQERVSPRQDNTDHIFSSSNAHVRSGFSSVETKFTKKSFLPNPPSAGVVHAPTLTDICGVAVPTKTKVVASVPHRFSGAPTMQTIDVSPVESPRTTLKSKIRETTLHTGKTVQSSEPRKLPTAGERFEASFRALSQHKQPAAW
ncbi:Hypothetical protein, putative [Bodo saltans]|uniref:Uncharacterized protein n=1 Tax=Bodo saltans TaxID=75058 RepID=A0A0S4J8A7_BODSA|nr:Hypothetical protein, putative [Bodo saltans]|eukprot:CUG67204.1 Hypothetical protein, putative [Bodo saltans]